MRFLPRPSRGLWNRTVRQHIDLTKDLHSYAGKMKAAGIVLDEAKRRYTIPARFRAFELSPWSWTISAAIEKYYR